MSESTARVVGNRGADEGDEEAEVDERANASGCDVESAGALLSVDCRRRPCPRAPRCGMSGRAPLRRF